MHPLVVAIVFGVVAIAELPDKSMFASLVLSTRYRASWVFTGVAAAFLVHVIIAVAAGGLLALLPRRLVEGIVAVLFAAGAAVLLLGREEREVEEGIAEGAAVVGGTQRTATFRGVALTCFGVVFLGEWGDITQIVTANYAARYDDPVSVAIGATLGLWAVSGLAVTAGRRVLERVAPTVVRRITGLVLIVFAVLSAASALR